MGIRILEFVRNEKGLIVNQPEPLYHLEAVLRNPGQVSWQNAHYIVLDGLEMTLWKAVGVINPKFTEFKLEEEDWDEIPTKEEIIKAIYYAVFQKNDFVRN